MKPKILFVILLLFCSSVILPTANPWGEIKKIHFYDSIKKYDQVLVHLAEIDFERVKRSEQKEIAARLIRFGDHYLNQRLYDYADAFYRKVLLLSPDYWYIYNKLDKINRAKGAWFFTFSDLFKQWGMLTSNFKASFLMLNHAVNMLFFAGLLVFFLFGGMLFVKYFRLAGNDLLIVEDGPFPIKKAIIIGAILIWPAIILTGWLIYPFLLSGFLWFYLNENERKAILSMLVVIGVLTTLYALNLVLENTYRDENFKMVQKVYDGYLFGKEDYSTFDDELKVAQAFSYYENGQYDTAMDILSSTNENYQTTQKLDLMGNINYKYGEIAQSGKCFRDSLAKDANNEVALNNYTLVLLKGNSPQAFTGYAKRYPQLNALRTQELQLKEIKLHQRGLWKRLFNLSKATFNPIDLLTGVFGQLLKLPILYYMLFFFIYIMTMKKFNPHLGESTYCSKCTKIIKEASVHRSYKLCDECYQLFSIKDVIFLEAKILKEKELKKKFKKKYLVYLLLSVIIPGINYNLRENHRVFLVLSMAFYFLAGFALLGAVNFNNGYAASPIIFNLVGMLAVLLYFLVNLFSVIGDEDGI